MPDPTAAAPTKGFPWAFPDQAPIEERRGSSSGESSVERSEISRQNSYAASINSSIYTADSNMPAGQKRFDDGKYLRILFRTEIKLLTQPQTYTPHTIIRCSTDLSQACKQQSKEAHRHRVVAITAVPLNCVWAIKWLSVSVAARWNRYSMSLIKSFQTLQGANPANGRYLPKVGLSTRTLQRVTKTNISSAIEHIKGLKYASDAMRRDNERMRTEVDMGRRCDEENRVLRTEVQAMWQHLQRVDPNNSHVFGNLTNQLAHEHPAPASAGPSSMLPPLQQQAPQWQQPAPPNAMQGVEFPSRGPGYEHRWLTLLAYTTVSIAILWHRGYHYDYYAPSFARTAKAFVVSPYLYDAFTTISAVRHQFYNAAVLSPPFVSFVIYLEFYQFGYHSNNNARFSVVLWLGRMIGISQKRYLREVDCFLAHDIWWELWGRFASFYTTWQRVAFEVLPLHFDFGPPAIICVS
jgi:hypothetical protein